MRRAETAGNDDDVGATEGERKGAGHRREIVADRRMIKNANADFGERTAQILRVRIKDRSGSYFVADRYDFGDDSTRRRRSVGAERGRGGFFGGHRALFLGIRELRETWFVIGALAAVSVGASDGRAGRDEGDRVAT